MVTRTFGRFPLPSASTIAAGTATPVAVLPAVRTVVWNLMVDPSFGRTSRHGLWRCLRRWCGRHRVRQRLAAELIGPGAPIPASVVRLLERPGPVAAGRGEPRRRPTAPHRHGVVRRSGTDHLRLTRRAQRFVRTSRGTVSGTRVMTTVPFVEETGGLPCAGRHTVSFADAAPHARRRGASPR